MFQVPCYIGKGSIYPDGTCRDFVDHERVPLPTIPPIRVYFDTNEEVFAWEMLRIKQCGRIDLEKLGLESCRRLKLPVRDYLAAVLRGLADLPIQRIPALTPAAWAAAQLGSPALPAS
jgi:hypothetical protein